MFGNFLNKKYFEPLILKNDINYYINIKTSKNYFVGFDISGNLFYYGQIYSESIINDEILFCRKIPFISNKKIIDYLCLENIISILDNDGNVYLYNEKDGINKIKLNQKIKKIFPFKNNFILISNEMNNSNLFLFSNNNKYKNIANFIENNFNLNFKIKKFEILNTYYFNPNELIFKIYTKYDEILEKDEKIFLLNYSMNNIYEHISTDYNNNNNFNLNKTVLNNNKSYHKINNDNYSKNLSKSYLRGNKISNLLEKLFDFKLNNIEKYKSRAINRKIKLEKININNNEILNKTYENLNKSNLYKNFIFENNENNEKKDKKLENNFNYNIYNNKNNINDNNKTNKTMSNNLKIEGNGFKIINIKQINKIIKNKDKNKNLQFNNKDKNKKNNENDKLISKK